MSDNTNYIEYTFRVSPLQPGSDILMAELGEAGFESFVEQEDGLLGYIQQTDWTEDILSTVNVLQSDWCKIAFDFKEIPKENWNADWESNFDPILISDACVVRAPFHEKPEVTYDIVIEPKMSFGTGHHETTHMMLQQLLATDVDDKSVLDMGCGTGVLAILCALKGATEIDAIDIDNWCYLNSLENAERNNCSNITVMQGDVSLLEGRNYDVIIANINRNILLADIPTYANSLNRKGELFLSGFYKEDIEIISKKCNDLGLFYQNKLQKNDWVSMKYIKS